MIMIILIRALMTIIIIIATMTLIVTHSLSESDWIFTDKKERKT